MIGQEAKTAFQKVGDSPDIVISCAGGGSNLARISFPFIADKIAGQDIKVIAVEPAACPTLSRGEFRYDFGDAAQSTPLLPMYTLGHTFIPPSIHAGGLRYHGMAPLVSQLVASGLIDAVAFHQRECFDAGVLFARTEGITPAPESNHAIRAAIVEMQRCKKEGTEKVILFNLSGHGHLDLAAYDAYFADELEDYALPEKAIAKAMDQIKGLPLID